MSKMTKSLRGMGILLRASFASLVLGSVLSSHIAYADELERGAAQTQDSQKKPSQEPLVVDEVETEEVTGSLIKHHQHHYHVDNTTVKTEDDMRSQGAHQLSDGVGFSNPIDRQKGS